MPRSSTEPAFSRHLDDWQWDDLLAATEAVRDLQAHPGWRVVVRVLDAERAKVDAILDGSGEPLEQARYAQLHGRRSALSAPEAVIAAVLDKHDRRLQELNDEREPVGAGMGD